MLDDKHRGQRRASRPAAAEAIRLQPLRESRLTLALVGLLSLATMSILATTTNLSRQHAEQVSIQLHR
jgi:hypothetical protein